MPQLIESNEAVIINKKEIKQFNFSKSQMNLQIWIS